MCLREVNGSQEDNLDVSHSLDLGSLTFPPPPFTFIDSHTSLQYIDGS